MSSRVAEMVRELEQRAAELRPLADELREVEAALKALRAVELSSDETPNAAKRGSRGSAKKSKSRGATRKKATVERAPRGQRREQVLSAVLEHPGATAREVAEHIGIAPNQVQGLVARLVKEGALVRDSGRLNVTSTDGATGQDTE